MSDIGPRTSDAFLALPEGGGFGMELREIDGKQWRVPVLEPVVAFYVAEDTIVSLVDRNGERWKLGRYADGRWFRQRT
jgi:hypothetical protein